MGSQDGPHDEAVLGSSQDGLIEGSTQCCVKTTTSIPQVRTVKTWAKAYDVLGSQDGCINSYAYVLLVLNYLISVNFLPNLQLLACAMGVPPQHVVVKKWGTPDIVDTRFWSAKIPDFRPAGVEALSLHQLTANFFQFYLKFPWESAAVCIRQQ